MASLQARHLRGCPIGPWTKLSSKAEMQRAGCTCGSKISYVARYWDGAKNRQRTLGRDLEEAKRELDAIEEKQYKKRRGFVPSVEKNISFEAWADRWTADSNRKANTARGYRHTIDVAKQTFRDRLVRTLDVDDVLDFLKALNGGSSESTKAKHLRVLAGCLQAATESGYADRNPARNLPKSFRPKRGKSKPAYFTDDELTALWPNLPAEMPAAVYRYISKLAVTTGMRQGELIALRWMDIHELDREIHVAQSFTSGIGVTSPKSGEARTIDLTDDALGVLAAWTKLAGAGEGADLVFPHPLIDTMGRTRAEKGSYLIGSTLTRILYDAMERAGIDRIGERGAKRDFHSLRHSYARIALESGERIDRVQRQLGHSSISLTVDVYGHWGREAEKAAAKQLVKGTFPV